MIKKIKSSLLALLLTAGLSASAYAEFNIGLKANMMGFYGVGSETPSDNAGVKYPVKEAGAFTDEVFSIFAEYDAGPISIGIGYIPETIASPENKNVQHTSDTDTTALTNTAKVDINDILQVYALVDVPQLGGSYIKVGWREATVETKENLETGGSYNDVDVEGYSVAIGYAFDTGAEGLSVRLEVEGSQYDDVEATNNSDTSTKIKVTDLMSASASISLVKSF